jgi:hypothetical protein
MILFTRSGRFVLCILGALLATRCVVAVPPGTFSLRIAVDQFGYLPDMPKVAVISDPALGFNAAESYTPGATFQVRTWGSNTIVFTGAPANRAGGATNSQSGDVNWWFDFSSITRWGDYYVYDPSTDARSARFRIGPDVYEEVMKHAMRMYYYQRRGAAKQLPYADARWTDGTNFIGPLQDTQCRLITNPTLATEKDLHGGWFDAGDYNKYVNWTVGPISELLQAYRNNPLFWPDNWNIPESGNGVPDILDEVKWELDWLLRMQNTNGSVLSKQGVNGFQGASPPSAETSQTFYGAESTTSTLTAAGNFAQAAPLYRSVGMTNYALTLSNAAVAAYNWAVANPTVIFTNTGFASGSPEVDTSTTNNYNYARDSLRIRAAVYLYDLTGLAAYKNYVESNYAGMLALSSTWWGPYEMPVQDALLYYTTLAGVTPSVVTTIRNSKQSSIDGGDWMGAWNSGTDPYRAYVPDWAYHWGSSASKCRWGILFGEQLIYALNPASATTYRNATAAYVNYMHGVNPLTMVFLSNMYDYGAENCANEIYHSWFNDGTIYDDALTSPNGPAPGYVPGGPNASFAPDASYSGPRLAPPMDQPPQKSYKDWNTGWPEDSWEITEPDLGYQSAYVYLLSRFVRPLTYADWVSGHGLTGSATNIYADPDGDGVCNLMEFAFNLSPEVADKTALPQFQLQSHTVAGQPGRYLTVQFLRQLGNTNLTYIVQASPDLVTWSDVCTAAGTNHPSGTGFVSETGTSYQRQVVARDVIPVEQATGPRFVRFKLIWN